MAILSHHGSESERLPSMQVRKRGEGCLARIQGDDSRRLADRLDGVASHWSQNWFNSSTFSNDSGPRNPMGLFRGVEKYVGL